MLRQLEKALELVDNVVPLFSNEDMSQFCVYSGNKEYLVTVTKHNQIYCNCKHYEIRRNLCKHALAVVLWYIIKNQINLNEGSCVDERVPDMGS
jgi:uncharacterized Zn finger protein